MNGVSHHSQKLLQRLQEQIDQLKTELNALNSKTRFSTLQRFDNRLFSPIVKNPNEYFLEIARNFDFLKQQVNNNNLEKTQFLAEKLIAQISALQRELATQPLRAKESNQNERLVQQDLYQKLSQYQDYQRRLKDMIRDKESFLALENQAKNQRVLQHEIVVLEGRYARCCNAIKALERQIEKYEKR